ncbi:MAG: sel1 repeat family protein [Rickettsiales bacterium]|jgi:TPR repeat protein|nr:sel1 repeat family protein [Rickettsiales bacterium]
MNEKNNPIGVQFWEREAENLPLGKLKAFAQFICGLCFYRGEFGAKQDFNRAVEYFKASTGLSFAPGRYWYGICLKNGDGVEKNLEEAAKRFKISAEQGFSDAQYQYGLCLYNGDGVEKNLKEAVANFEKAAKNGHEGAQKAYDVVSKRSLNEQNMLSQLEGVFMDIERGNAVIRRRQI